MRHRAFVCVIFILIAVARCMGYEDLERKTDCINKQQRCAGNFVQICKLNTWMSTENCTTFGKTCLYVDGMPTCIEKCDAGPDSGEDTDSGWDSDNDADGGADAHTG